MQPAHNNIKSILLIYTGGTIGMVKDLGTGLLKPLDFDHLINQIPELNQFGFKIHTLTFEPVIDSSEVEPGIWIKLARTIYNHYDEFDGFVILHGTDTMAYTASALSFLLQNLDKPVILTGAQLPIGTLRTDGKENIISSIEIAAGQKEGKPIVPGVSIYFEYKLLQGNRTTKYSAETFNAFISPNYPILAECGVHINYNEDVIHVPTPGHKPVLYEKMATGVTFLKIYPGISGEIVRTILSSKGLEALILETYGAGNAPTGSWLLQPLKTFIDNGGLVLNISQCLVGEVDMGQYETGQTLKNIGVLGGRDLTREAAITKMMFLLGNFNDPVERKFLLSRSICGEMNG